MNYFSVCVLTLFLTQCFKRLERTSRLNQFYGALFPIFETQQPQILIYF